MEGSCSSLLPSFLGTILPSLGDQRTMSAFRKIKEYRIESDVLLIGDTYMYHTSSPNRIKNPEGGGGMVLPSNRPMGMCCWMRSHFHNWIDYYGDFFNIVIRMRSHIFGIWGEILESRDFEYMYKKKWQDLQ